MKTTDIEKNKLIESFLSLTIKEDVKKEIKYQQKNILSYINAVEEKIKETENISFKKESEKEKKLIFNYHDNLEKSSEERLMELRKNVENLRKIKQPVQKSDEWLKMRENMITASDWAAALGKGPSYATRNKLIRAKCGEKQVIFDKYMKHGVKYEPVANMIYEYRNQIEVIEFGLIPHPKIDFLGASPDGITKDGIMVEIKCPPKREITGEIPNYYWIQVQGQLEVCDLDRCDFIECKIEEYDSEDDYYNDNYNGDHFFNQLGMEKGIVIVFMNKEKNSLYFEYSKLGINREEFIKWSNEIEEKILKDENMSFVEYTYWKLTEVSCIPIYRDKKWFEDNLPLLEKFWNDVLYYRKNGIEELLPKAKVKSKKEIYIDTGGEENENKSKCLFNLNNFKKQNNNEPKEDEQIKTSNKCLFNLDKINMNSTEKKVVKIKVKKSNNSPKPQ